MTAVDQAAKFLALAEALESPIQQKLNSGVAQQNLTARRARIAEGMEVEGRRLQRVQTILRHLAGQLAGGTLLDYFAGIRNRTQVEELLGKAEHSVAYPRDERDQSSDQADYRARGRGELARMGIPDARTYELAMRAIRDLVREPQVDPVELQIRQLERELIGNQIPGFFQTPAALADLMVQRVDLRPGHRVLEPSAGDGRIAEAIRRAQPSAALTTIEINPRLAQILTLKGFDPICGNCLEHDGAYDRILMNPPFERFQDIDHVRLAYTLLKPGGRLIAIMSPGPFFRQEAKAGAFREFVFQPHNSVDELPEQTFAGGRQLRSTGVRAHLVLIKKAEDTTPARCARPPQPTIDARS